MRLNLHDYSGHPFQAELARYLAGQGHEVVHTYSSQYVTGRGRLRHQGGDPETLRFEPLTADAALVKYSPLGRARFEVSYAAAWRAFLERDSYDLIVACNVPLLALARMRRYFARRAQPWVLWHQDIYSMAMKTELHRTLPGPLARVASRGFERFEAAQVASADAVVAISDGFVAKYAEWDVVRPGAQHVVPNWAPLDELVPCDRDNAWSRRQGLPTSGIRLVYAGTLGRKHNPLLLVELLDQCKRAGVEASLVVVSEGVGADDLRAAAGNRPDVRVLGYQPAEEMSQVLGSADLLVALLEPDAAQFSVPSKVYSYVSVGRPIVALMPDGNPAAGLVREAGGCVAQPTSRGAAEAAGRVREICAPGELAARSVRARHLAEQRFAIDRIGPQFDAIFRSAAGLEQSPARPGEFDALASGPDVDRKSVA
jgi:glycosyltransferase involved in cell wall biosynthesis